MRFQVSQVMDAIEQRLTTDVTGAQAVVDLGEVVRYVDLDGGRPVNLVRIGMVVDALSRYLVDGGAMLYGVVERALLSESALTSKERMVVSRWADDGLIEVTPAVGDRVAEIADLTGLPMVTLSPEPSLADLAARFGWQGHESGRLLRLVPRCGAAVLRPVDRAVVDVDTDRDAGQDGDADPGTGDDADAPGAADGAPVVGRAKVPSATDGSAESAAEGSAQDADGAAGELPLPVQVFADRVTDRDSRVRVSRNRYLRAEPSRAYPAGSAPLARQWRCDERECPAFGELRRIGQPVPQMRDDVPVCPRHDEPVTDAGPRPPAYAVSIVVNDLPRRRLVVRGEEALTVGRGDDNDPDLVSVAHWLHRAAANWISPAHLRLEAREDGLVVTDLSANGTVVWQRTGPDDPGTTRALRRESYQLGEWDSVELYTGIEVMRGDRRPAAVLGAEPPASVLVDAPTASHRQLGPDNPDS